MNTSVVILCVVGALYAYDIYTYLASKDEDVEFWFNLYWGEGYRGDPISAEARLNIVYPCTLAAVALVAVT